MGTLLGASLIYSLAHAGLPAAVSAELPNTATAGNQGHVEDFVE